MKIFREYTLAGALLFAAPAGAATVAADAVGCKDRDEIFRVVEIATNTDDATFMDEMIRLKVAGLCDFLRPGTTVKVLERAFGTLCVIRDGDDQCLWTTREAISE